MEQANGRRRLSIEKSAWWKRESVVGHGSTMIAVLGALLWIAPVTDVGAYVIESDFYNPKIVPEVPRDMCVTPACIYTASEFLHGMDKNVEPCDNFYRFVCGGFLNETSIPDDKAGVDVFSTIRDRVQEQLRKSISKPIEHDDIKPVRLVKNLYNSCMNTTAIEDQGLEPLSKILKKLGGWPVLEGDAWDKKNFSWIESVYKFRDEGYPVNYFFDLYIGVDLQNSTNRVITLAQPPTGLSREFFAEGKDPKIMNAYRRYMIDIAVKLGAPRDVAENELTESFEFEKKIANISLPEGEQCNATMQYYSMMLSELLVEYPSIPWKEFFNRLLAPKNAIGDDEIIVVMKPDCVSAIIKLIQETPPRTQANYVMWRAVKTSIRYLNQDLRDRQMKYATEVTGVSEIGARWKECIDIVVNQLPFSVGALYIKEHFKKNAKRDVVEIVDNIKNEFNEILKKVDWLDEDTRQSALDKAASMSAHIAYPDELLDDEKLGNFYNPLELNGENFLKSILNVTLFGMEYSLGELRKPINKSDWKKRKNAAIVNAFYSPTQNSIEFPAAVLQGTLFNNERPKYVNYGAIGFVIGHEITHGFGNLGRLFDKNGNLIDWWAQSTEEKYLQKVECIIDQYDNYTDRDVGLNLDGSKTLDENIADNGGIKVAYLAYKKWVSKNGNEQTLPGLDFTPRQLFWISAANTWCSKFRPETLKLNIATDNHSPSEFRVLGSFSNIVDFAKDFNCQEGSGMNPKKKCDVW